MHQLQETIAAYAHVPLNEMTPWWWPRTRAIPTIPKGFGAFRKVGICLGGTRTVEGTRMRVLIMI